jgi:hypothetical protein
MSCNRILFASAFLVLACGRSDVFGAPPLASADRAAAGFAALSSVLDSIGTISAAASAGREPYDDVVSVQFDFPCHDRGTVAIVGTLLNASGDRLEVESSLEYLLSFTGCTSERITIDGTLDYAASITADLATGQHAYRFEYLGAVEFTGSVTGFCELEAVATSTTDSRLLDYEGTICGYDANSW